MIEVKCPFCREKLQEDIGYDGDYSCPNCTEPYFGSLELWQELIRTRKALEIAINAMKSAGTHNSINCIARGEDPSKDDVGITINNALNKITTLE